MKVLEWWSKPCRLTNLSWILNHVRILGIPCISSHCYSGTPSIWDSFCFFFLAEFGAFVIWTVLTYTIRLHFYRRLLKIITHASDHFHVWSSSCIWLSMILTRKNKHITYCIVCIHYTKRVFLTRMICWVMLMFISESIIMCFGVSQRDIQFKDNRDKLRVVLPYIFLRTVL